MTDPNPEIPDQPRPTWRRVALRMVLPLVLMVLILGQLVRMVEWGNLVAAFGSLRVVYFLPLTVLHLVTVLAIAPLIWYAILRSLGSRPGLAELCSVWVGIACLRAILPLRSGGIIGANYLRRRVGLPLTGGIGSLVFLHFLNFYSLWAYLAAGLWFTGRGGPALRLGLTVVLVALPVVLPWIGLPIRLAARVHPRLGEFLGHLAVGFTGIRPAARLGLFSFALAVQAIDIAVVGLGLAGAGVRPPAAELVLRIPFIYLAASLPVTLMGVGTREAALVFAFGNWGADASILAAGLGLSFCLEIVPMLVSLAFLPRALAMGLLPRRRIVPAAPTD